MPLSFVPRCGWPAGCSDHHPNPALLVLSPDHQLHLMENLPPVVPGHPAPLIPLQLSYPFRFKVMWQADLYAQAPGSKINSSSVSLDEGLGQVGRIEQAEEAIGTKA